MSAPRIIQRSPDLGIGIRLQPVRQAVKQVPPKPPYWWGWDVLGVAATELEAPHEQDVLRAYWPGLWAALVEGATTVAWQIEFTPVVWVSWFPDPEAILAWQGQPVSWVLPPDGTLPEPGVIFAPAKVALPDPLTVGTSEIALDSYWYGGAGGVPLPLCVAAGNTLSVSPEAGSISGILVAKALLLGATLGTVQLTLKRVNPISLV